MKRGFLFVSRDHVQCLPIFLVELKFAHLFSGVKVLLGRVYAQSFEAHAFGESSKAILASIIKLPRIFLFTT